MVKSFSWSFSKMKNFNTCPKRHYEVDIAKNYTESSDALTWGNEVHANIANAILGKSPLPDSMKDYQPWVEKCVPNLPGATVEVELQLAITKDFEATHWKDWDGAWCRTIADVVLFDPSGEIGIVRDWKTGKPEHNATQLVVNSTALFAQFPKLQTIVTKFVWLKAKPIYESQETYTRDTIFQEWPALLANVKEMENAATTMEYPPKPGKLCAKWCPVSTCAHYGKRYS